LVRIGPTAWPFTGFIHTYIHTDRQLDKYILDMMFFGGTALGTPDNETVRDGRP
jgi:hypothetical protein